MKWNLLFINKAIIIVHTYDPEFCKIGRVFDSECYLVLRVAAYKWMNFKKVSKIYSSLPPIVSHLICHAFGNRRNIVLCDTHTRTHTQPHTHTHWYSAWASSSVQANNLSEVPFLYSVGRVRKRVCKAFGAEQDLLSTSVLDDICDQRDMCCACASSVLQSRLWPGGCTGPFCGCLETLPHKCQLSFMALREKEPHREP